MLERSTEPMSKLDRDVARPQSNERGLKWQPPPLCRPAYDCHHGRAAASGREDHHLHRRHEPATPPTWLRISQTCEACAQNQQVSRQYRAPLGTARCQRYYFGINKECALSAPACATTLCPSSHQGERSACREHANVAAAIVFIVCPLRNNPDPASPESPEWQWSLPLAARAECSAV
jgi:hypothetical protein